jgi:sensor histidine kinase regulating citrate/malate metabolism
MFDGFWQNISRYFRYFITIILGVFLNAIAPLAPLFKRPITAIATVSLLIGFFVFISFTLRAMLGLSPIY